MKFPSIKDVAAELRAVNVSFGGPLPEDAPCDVRLQVYSDGQWAIRVGDPSYDLDHRGYWGCSCLDGRAFNSYDLARELIKQAKEDAALCGE